MVYVAVPRVAHLHYVVHVVSVAPHAIVAFSDICSAAFSRHWSAAVYARAVSCTRLAACIAKQIPIVVVIRTTVVTLVIIVVSHVWRAYDTTHV